MYYSVTGITRKRKRSKNNQTQTTKNKTKFAMMMRQHSRCDRCAVDDSHGESASVKSNSRRSRLATKWHCQACAARSTAGRQSGLNMIKRRRCRAEHERGSERRSQQRLAETAAEAVQRRDRR